MSRIQTNLRISPKSSLSSFRRLSSFIFRLHVGQLKIPWPVIESQEFYSLFPALKRRLGKQKLTHNTAGEFLHTVKTLMAKLKANDWGALSESMASHRHKFFSPDCPTLWHLDCKRSILTQNL
ncbi:hypothetical protein BDR05DRAFT_192482 [Suillus weaverae]|nr:hypothetical protein BDR05DRAFT_192482 [Suillus weaverae]